MKDWDFDKLFAVGNVVGVKNIPMGRVFVHEVVKSEWSCEWSCEECFMDWKEYKNPTLTRSDGCFQIEYIITIDEHGNVIEKLFDRKRDMPKVSTMPELKVGMFGEVLWWNGRDFEVDEEEYFGQFLVMPDGIVIYKEGYDNLDMLCEFIEEYECAVITKVYGDDCFCFGGNDKEIIRGMCKVIESLENKIGELERLIDCDTESAPTSTKLYCVKDYEPGEWLTKGNVYELDEHDYITYDDGYETSYNPDNYYDGDARCGDHLIPLVDRKAQKDEWIYITESGDDRAVVGEIYQFVEEGLNSLHIKHPEGMRCGDSAANIDPSKYLVLDGYVADYEEDLAPTYYTGKVVCVDRESFLTHWTIGKVYVVVNGTIYDDDHEPRTNIESIEDLNNHNMKFIEYKGGA